MKRCSMFGRPDRVMRPASVVSFARSPPLSTPTVLPAAIPLNAQHVAAFAVSERPFRLNVMFAPLAKLVEALVYQMESVTPSCDVPLPFVNSRAFVQVLPAASVMLKWVLVFPSVVTKLSVATTMTPILFWARFAELVVNVHDEEAVLWFAVQKEPTLAKDAAAPAAFTSTAIWVVLSLTPHDQVIATLAAPAAVLPPFRVPVSTLLCRSV